MKTSILLILFLKSFSLIAQSPIDTSAIIRQLTSIHERDQKTRANGDSIQFIHYIDSCNLAQVESLIARYGWPGKSFVGPYGNYTVFLVIQHAELATQEKYFPMFQKSVEQGESRPSDLAYLQDRILMRQGKKQMYGSQIILNNTGGQEFYPIEDEKNINTRRKAVGLGPIEAYAERFGIEYKMPKE